MSKWRTTDGTVVWRAVTVGEFHDDADALDYLRAQSRADDGREVC